MGFKVSFAYICAVLLLIPGCAYQWNKRGNSSFFSSEFEASIQTKKKFKRLLTRFKANAAYNERSVHDLVLLLRTELEITNNVIIGHKNQLQEEIKERSILTKYATISVQRVYQAAIDVARSQAEQYQVHGHKYLYGMRDALKDIYTTIRVIEESLADQNAECDYIPSLPTQYLGPYSECRRLRLPSVHSQSSCMVCPGHNVQRSECRTLCPSSVPSQSTCMVCPNQDVQIYKDDCQREQDCQTNRLAQIDSDLQDDMHEPDDTLTQEHPEVDVETVQTDTERDDSDVDSSQSEVPEPQGSQPDIQLKRTSTPEVSVESMPPEPKAVEPLNSQPHIQSKRTSIPEVSVESGSSQPEVSEPQVSQPQNQTQIDSTPESSAKDAVSQPEDSAKIVQSQDTSHSDNEANQDNQLQNLQKETEKLRRQLIAYSALLKLYRLNNKRHLLILKGQKRMLEKNKKNNETF